ncbi:MAG: metallophosphoesterase [Planctomycetota bacterium]|jgi:predicted MPP superfamily phosphohydrolase
MRMGTLAVRKWVVPVSNLPQKLHGLRIAHVSDLHLHKWKPVYEQLTCRLARLDYDLLVVTGDFAHLPWNWKHTCMLGDRVFEPLADARPIFGVLGNHDHPRIADAGLAGIRFLRNESTKIEIRGCPIHLAGVEQTNYAPDDLEKARREHTESSPRLLLAHHPSTVNRLDPGAYDLVLSGHTHGGQIRLPMIGCLWANDRIPLRMAMGLHRYRSTLLHTSPGIGVSGPLKVRFRCPPEISILSLQPAVVPVPACGRPSISGPRAPREILAGV